MSAMRVALGDDSALFREGLRRLLEGEGIEVTAWAANPDEICRAVASVVPDVVVLDVRMPPTFTDEGIRTAGRLRSEHAGLPVLVLSTYAETSFAVRLLELGSRGLGYLLKDRVGSVDVLIDALTRLVAGESVVDPEIIGRLLAHQRARSVIDRLTSRELEVLRLMAEGHSNAGIGRRLYLVSRER
jgi:DNA-binding NarL/FixJ family response regulator